MADVRDPERDQPLPRPGRIPVQEVMIRAIDERRAYGKRKYGRALETHNGRDALKDAWEEALDLFTYLTQMRLERGDVIEGMESMAGSPEPAPLDEARSPEVRGLAEVIPERCPLCRHEPHTIGRCRSQALNLGCPCGT